MPSQINGLPLNIASSMPAQVNIASSTNTTPIQVTTSTPHGLTSGDGVDIRGHRTNTSANGTWISTVIGPSSLSLVGSAGVGVGGATGTLQSLALGPTFPVPSDGDPRNAASVDAALEALADRTAWLGLYTGAYALTSVASVSHDDNGAGNVWGTVAIASTGVWTAFTGVPAGFSGVLDNVIASDILEITLDTSINFDSAMKSLWATLYVGHAVPAASPSYSYARAAGAAKSFQSASALPILPLSLRAVVTGVTDLISVVPYGLSGFYTGSDGYLLGDYLLTVKQWRATGKPQ